MIGTRRAVCGLTALGLVTGTFVAGSAGAYSRPGLTARVDVGPNGEQAKTPATNLNCQPVNCQTPAAISGNGRYVVFVSYANNLVAGDRDNGPDVFVRDLHTGVTTIASVSSTGQPQVWVNLLNAVIDSIAISADGRYVAFGSAATTLVPGDTNLAMDVFVRDLKTKTTTRVDVSPSGGQTAQGTVHGLSMSADGRYVAFASASPDLVGGDTNGVADVFVRDRKTGTTQRATVSTSGAQGDDASTSGFSLSPTGRWLVFGSDATNLVAGDTNLQRDVFLRDLTKHVTEPISLRPNGSEAPVLAGNSDASYGPGSAISADGRYVVFSSNSMLLIPNDSNRQNSDWFVRDRIAGRTMRVSVASDGTDRQISSTANASITPDGRYVAFRTAENLAPDDQGLCPTGIGGSETDNDVYVHDMRTGAADLISRSSGGAHAYASPTDAPSGCQNSSGASISDDGRTVVFDSTATNLVKGDTNKEDDVYVRDRGTALGVGGLIGSAPSSAPPSQPPTCVESECLPVCANDVCVPPGDAALIGARVAVRPALRDLFVDVEAASLASGPDALYGLDFAAGKARFELRMQRDAFALFRRTADSRWTYVASVTGGYGTTGADAVAAIPMADLGLSRGDVVSDVSAFSAVGTVATGVVRLRAELRLNGVAHV
jgi:Tol biopolymer transport system component